jgi:phosphoribosylanthranilate isomerase
MWVKICGITRYEDALTACESGADAIGIVLTRSVRRVDPVAAEQWIHTISGVEKVGVFTDEDPGYIRETAGMLGLDTIQLHTAMNQGHRVLAGMFGIICAVSDLDEALIPKDIPCRVLLDPSTGSGRTGTWRRYDIPFILAGGLTPENVRQAIIRAQPAGVDVSSGVESSHGIKDEEKVRKFIKEAKS